MKKATTNRPHYATGSALLVCLVLLVIMTLLVVGGISISTTQEKMTGNTQNKQISFQAAESALRMAENLLQNSAAVVFNNAGAYSSHSKPDDADFPIWEKDDDMYWRSFTLPTTTTISSPVVKDPQVIFEFYGRAARDQNCRVLQNPDDSCKVDIYRITAKGYGINENGVTLLQSTYRTK